MRKPLLTRFHLLLLGVLVSLTATAFVKVPAAAGLPVHWGLDGKPDQIWPRDEALWVFPGVAAVLVILFLAIGQFAPEDQIKGGRPVIETAIAGLLGLCCAMQFAFILLGIGSDIDLIRVITTLLALIFTGLGLALPRSRPNVYAGIRLPWTMQDARNWQATHRLTGALMVVAGVALGAVALLWPTPADMLIAVGLAVFLPILMGGVFSFLYARR